MQRFGADDFMKKPFGRDEVYRRIEQLVLPGRLAPRSATGAVIAPAIPAAATVHDAIPDIAMPDAEIAHGLDDRHA